MEILEWVKEVEEIYENLVSKAKTINSSKIKGLKEEQQKLLKDLIEKKQNYTNSIIKELTAELDEEQVAFEAKIDDAIDRVQKNYNNNKNKLLNTILNKFELEF